MKILFLSRWYPYPPNNGSKIRVYNIIRGLARDHEVVLVSFFDPRETIANSTILESMCSEIHTIPFKEYEPTSFRSLTGFFRPVPRSILDTYSFDMEQTIKKVIGNGKFDLAIASGMTMASYVNCLNGIPAIWEEVETGVFYQRFTQSRSLARQLRHRFTYIKLKGYLSRLLNNFCLCTVVSDLEKQILSQLVPGYSKIEVVPNAVNLEDYQGITPSPCENTMVYTGSFRYFANHDAMVWFVSEIFPRIQAVVPGVQLMITGDSTGFSLPKVDGVHLAGHINDIRPVVANAWVSVAPVRIGGGTRIKILEAMALSTPVVATSKGAEGLDVVHNRHILIADTPREFAEAVIRIIEDRFLRDELTSNARRLVEEKYDWRVVIPRINNLIGSVGKKQLDLIPGESTDLVR